MTFFESYGTLIYKTRSLCQSERKVKNIQNLFADGTIDYSFGYYDARLDKSIEIVVSFGVLLKSHGLHPIFLQKKKLENRLGYQK